MNVEFLMSDSATASLSKFAQALSPANRRALLAAAGAEVLSAAKGSFNDAALRPSPWAPLSARTLAMRKRRGHRGTAILKASGALWHSIRRTSLTDTSVSIGTDRPYANVQQFGASITITTHAHSQVLKYGKNGKFISNKKALKKKTGAIRFAIAQYKARTFTVKIPPRPFMPITVDGEITSLVRSQVIGTVRAAIKRNVYNA